MGKRALLLALAVLLLGGCEREAPQQQAEGPRKVPVEVVEVRRAVLTRWVETVGTVMPRQAVVVNPKVPGKIEAIYVDEGDRVSKGQVIVKLEQTDFLLGLQRASSALESAKAALAQAEVNYERAEKDYGRFRALLQQRVISQREFDQVEAACRAAQAQLRLARARVKEAEVAVENAKNQLRDTLIRAPFDGYVSARFVDPGQRAYTMPPTKIMEIVDIAQVKVVLDLPERELPLLGVGTPVEAEVDAFPREVFRGEIGTVFPKVDPKTRTFRAEVVLENPRGALRPGMFCRVRVPVARVEALVVPREAVLRMPATGVDYCFVVQDGRAYQRNIKTGLKEGNLVQVLEGLKEGELVVVSGHADLRGGAEVEPLRASEGVEP